MALKESRLRTRWRWIAIAAALLLAVCIYLLVQLFANPKPVSKKKVIQEIQLIKPPPPPPPPKDTPPPPKQEQQKIDIPKPDQAPADKPAQAPPPGPDLAVDAAGNGAGDGFGLVGKKGGADLIGSGSGSAGSRFAWYGALIKERLHEAILKEKRLRDAKDYQRLVNVWMNPNGSVSRVELIGAVDSAELDSALRDALGKVLPVRENLPSDMPQPVRLRITAR